MLLLLSCWIVAAITAEKPPETHYREKNGSLCLRVKNSPPHHQDRWLFNEEAITFSNNITPKYKDKVSYSPINHSLCINKLTETDSGRYTFSFLNSSYKNSKETHRLIVEETVPTPVMRISALDSNLSAALCNITVNCSIGEEWAWSVCDVAGCRTSQRSNRKVTIINIFTDNTSVVCGGKNHVSASNVSESTEAMCLINPEETSHPPSVVVAVLMFAVCVSLCVFVLLGATGLLPSGCSGHQEGTPAARIAQSQQAEASPPPEWRVSTSSSSSQAEACYVNVEAPPPRQTSSPIVGPREETGSPQGEGDGGVGTEGHGGEQEASGSQGAPPGEEDHINSLYSVLQAPKRSRSPQ
uniref:uncharacterized protein LOC120821260 n=1 Tax=Gasterosteus aculeatus aculeatus TaxID=481459 RepID=UPI001A9A1B6E|nr:uncharacterized protein LOC120821260 [Gasterosteus aculeatus aculeatus]